MREKYLSPVESLRLKKKSGSAEYAKGPTGFESHGPFVHPEPLLTKLLNFDWLWKQFRTEGSVDYLRHGQSYRNQADRDVHEDNNRTQSAKYGSDQQKIIMEASHEQRAQEFLRKSGVFEFFKMSNGIEACGYFHAQMLSRIDKQVQDETLREQIKDALRIAFEQAIAEIRIISYGHQFDPQRGSYGDQF